MKVNKLLIQKFKGTISLITILCIGSIVLMLTAGIGIYINRRSCVESVELKDRLQHYRAVYGVGPDEVLERQEFIAQDLHKKYVEFVRVFTCSFDETAISNTPLAFKEKLFDFQEKIKQKASAKDIGLPESLGFQEYDFAVPEQEQIIVLNKELIAAEEVVSLLLNSRVNAITQIKLSHEYHNGALKTIPMQLSLESDFSSLNHFLKELVETERIYIVEKISIQRKKDAEKYLLVNIELEHKEI
ncbi:MAG: type 4a pilus biogenesis protein PilO [PVC group bacterium]|nr:type 4a pilus biogenesis protein PilO [PVC group bacterium]